MRSYNASHGLKLHFLGLLAGPVLDGGLEVELVRRGVGDDCAVSRLFIVRDNVECRGRWSCGVRMETRLVAIPGPPDVGTRGWT